MFLYNLKVWAVAHLVHPILKQETGWELPADWLPSCVEITSKLAPGAEHKELLKESRLTKGKVYILNFKTCGKRIKTFSFNSEKHRNKTVLQIIMNLKIYRQCVDSSNSAVFYLDLTKLEFICHACDTVRGK